MSLKTGEACVSLGVEFEEKIMERRINLAKPTCVSPASKLESIDFDCFGYPAPGCLPANVEGSVGVDAIMSGNLDGRARGFENLQNAYFESNSDTREGRVEEHGAPDFTAIGKAQGDGRLVSFEYPAKLEKDAMRFATGEGMRQLPESERPREKLIEKGPQSLSDAELLALLISSGTKNASALQIARNMLNHLGGVRALGQSQFDDLVEMAGIGDAKATTIVAAFELGRRHQSATKHRTFFTTPTQIAEYLRPHLSHQPHEVFRVLLLNKANSLLGERDMFRGGISSTCVDPLIVFRYALQHRATKLILSHNHPSGDCHPSQCDYDITDRIVRIGHTMGVRVVDHVIVSNWGYYSFSEEGLITDILQDHDDVEKKSSANRRRNMDAIKDRRTFGVGN